jgi:AAA+ superfamily predicted ATPase
MADDFEYEEEYTMEQHYEQEAEQSISDVDPATMIVNIQTPMGPITVDMKQLEDAKKAVAATRAKESPLPLGDQMMNNFIGTKHKRDSRYWRGKLGVLMKLHFDIYLAEEFEVVEEFMIDQGKMRAAIHESIELQDGQRQRFLAAGTRFYKSKTQTGHHLVTVSSVDHDGDQRISVYTSTLQPVEVHGKSAEELISDVEADFYQTGVLKGAFFDLQYNFIARDKQIDDLIAWDEDVKEALWRDIISFQKAMPKLRASGVPNSRGVILAGPPGTGKTMIAKWLAAHSDITCVLISAEMITGRNDIKSCFEMARKLSPTLLIIEDIDTAGALDRRASDHPLLGEFLQSMDGIVPNHGVITLATTNHSNKIDPAIADRPGRFDRIIEVGLPGKDQRFHIFHHLLKKLDLSRNVTLEVKEKLAKMTEGLTGAWIRAVVQDSLILALSKDKNKIAKEHLFAALKDVMERRGMAYRVAPYSPPQAKAKADVYVQ